MFFNISLSSIGLIASNIRANGQQAKGRLDQPYLLVGLSCDVWWGAGDSQSCPYFHLWKMPAYIQCSRER